MNFMYTRNDYLVVKLVDRLNAGDQILVNIDFERLIDGNEGNGIYWSRFIDSKTKWVYYISVENTFVSILKFENDFLIFFAKNRRDWGLK